MLWSKRETVDIFPFLYPPNGKDKELFCQVAFCYRRVVWTCKWWVEALQDSLRIKYSKILSLNLIEGSSLILIKRNYLNGFSLFSSSISQGIWQQPATLQFWISIGSITF